MYFGADHFHATILNYQKMIWCKKIVSKLPPLFFLFSSKKPVKIMWCKNLRLYMFSLFKNGHLLQKALLSKMLLWSDTEALIKLGMFGACSVDAGLNKKLYCEIVRREMMYWLGYCQVSLFSQCWFLCQWSQVANLPYCWCLYTGGSFWWSVLWNIYDCWKTAFKAPVISGQLFLKTVMMRWKTW